MSEPTDRERVMAALLELFAEGIIFPTFDYGDDVPKEYPAFPVVNCNDLFFWACADFEPVEPGDLMAIDQAQTDVENATQKHGRDSLAEAMTLWACRKRKMRPQRPWMRGMSNELRALYEAAGPERDE